MAYGLLDVNSLEISMLYAIPLDGDNHGCSVRVRAQAAVDFKIISGNGLQ
jgi:hypothetical protein